MKDKEGKGTFGSAREAVQLKQTLELGEHVRREIEKEQMKKDTPEGMLS